jgi:hypothetical protein
MLPEKRKTTELARTGKKQPGKRPKNSGQSLTAEQRHRMIEETAYYLAEKAGFNGDSIEHWLAAEREINGRFR